MAANYAPPTVLDSNGLHTDVKNASSSNKHGHITAAMSSPVFARTLPAYPSSSATSSSAAVSPIVQNTGKDVATTTAVGTSRPPTVRRPVTEYLRSELQKISTSTAGRAESVVSLQTGSMTSVASATSGSNSTISVPTSMLSSSVWPSQRADIDAASVPAFSVQSQETETLNHPCPLSSISSVVLLDDADSQLPGPILLQHETSEAQETYGYSDNLSHHPKVKAALKLALRAHVLITL